jgi:hypothetical protein
MHKVIGEIASYSFASPPFTSHPSLLPQMTHNKMKGV